MQTAHFCLYCSKAEFGVEGDTEPELGKRQSSRYWDKKTVALWSSQKAAEHTLPMSFQHNPNLEMLRLLHCCPQQLLSSTWRRKVMSAGDVLAVVILLDLKCTSGNG